MAKELDFKDGEPVHTCDHDWERFVDLYTSEPKLEKCRKCGKERDL